MDDQFRALANSKRRELLRLVRDEARPVGDLADCVGASQPATSQHLAVLRDAGLVSVTPVGRQRLYAADHDAVVEAQGFFDDYWSSALDRLASAAEQHAVERLDVS